MFNKARIFWKSSFPTQQPRILTLSASNTYTERPPNNVMWHSFWKEQKNVNDDDDDLYAGDHDEGAAGDDDDAV